MKLSIRLTSPEQAHAVMTRLVWPQIKAELQAGHEQALVIEPFDDSLTKKQRGYYHGIILTEIAAQVAVDGKRHSMAVWKEYFRDKYLGFRRQTFTNPLTGKKSRRRVRVSTEDIGVRRYAKLIDEVTAFASTELDVRFPAGSWETWDDE